MSRRPRFRVSGSMLVAIAALVMATTGSAVAASLVTSKQIKNGTITLKDINKKAVKSLKGKAGANGATGPAGAQGPAATPGAKGDAGAKGDTGPRGPGIVASANSPDFTKCVIATAADNFCYGAATELTPTANAKCSVSVDSQIIGLPAGTAAEGPFFRIAIKTGTGLSAVDADDAARGHYFTGTPTTMSTTLARTRLIPVVAGTTYNFGAFYAGGDLEFDSKQAYFNVSYVCFGT